MEQKKLLLLGAMQMHLPIIKRAKERGIYVITCDFIRENEGHKYADEAYYDSTTDLNAVLSLAKKCDVDGIMTFNSDPAALTAAYVADKLRLSGSGYTAVEIMSEKDKFRKFLSENGFSTPKFRQYTEVKALLNELEYFQFPVMLKPVDSSGSKGVVKITTPEEVEASFFNALTYSRSKRVIVEEFIQPEGAQMHGDAFIRNGKIEFIYLGDHHYDSNINNLVPISTTFPSSHSKDNIAAVVAEVQRFVTKVNFKQGGINIEARISAKDHKVYLIEVGPRNGGNFTPIIIQYASGFNFMDACLDVFLNMEYAEQHPCKKGFYAYMIIHSKQDGILAQIEIDSALSSKVFQRYDYLHIGEMVRSFKGANSAIGVLLVKFDSMEQMTEYVDNMERYCKVSLR